jgi:hypothetical protein
MSIYSKDYNNQIMTETNEPLTPDALKQRLYEIIANSTSQKDKGVGIWGFWNGDKKISEDDISDTFYYQDYDKIYKKWISNEGTSNDKNKQFVVGIAKQIVDLFTSAVKSENAALRLTQVVKDNASVKVDIIDTIKDELETVEELMKSNIELTIQQKQLDDRNKIIMNEKEKIITEINQQIEQQKIDHRDTLKEIKQQSDKTIEDKTNEITKAQEKLDIKIKELETVTKSLTDKDDIIKDLKSKMTAEDTKEIIDGEKEGILTTITRILPLSWKNAVGFNIGNIITTVKGVRPYTPNDTVDYFLHNELFKNQNTEEPDTIYNYGVPIYTNEPRTDGGRGNNINKKKTKKQRNIKTKKQRNIKTKKQRIIKTKKNN